MYVVMFYDSDHEMGPDIDMFGTFRSYEAAQEFADKVQARADKMVDRTGERVNPRAWVAPVTKPRLRVAYERVDERF